MDFAACAFSCADSIRLSPMCSALHTYWQGATVHTVTCVSVSLAISRLRNGVIGFVQRAALAMAGRSDSAAAAVHIHSCYSCITQHACTHSCGRGNTLCRTIATRNDVVLSDIHHLFHVRPYSYLLHTHLALAGACLHYYCYSAGP